MFGPNGVPRGQGPCAVTWQVLANCLGPGSRVDLSCPWRAGGQIRILLLQELLICTGEGWPAWVRLRALVTAACQPRLGAHHLSLMPRPHQGQQRTGGWQGSKPALGEDGLDTSGERSGPPCLAHREGRVTEDLLALGGCSRTWGGMGVGNNGSLWLAQQREGTGLALTPSSTVPLPSRPEVPREPSLCPSPAAP